VNTLHKEEEDDDDHTNHFKNKILKEEVNRKCWLCKQHEETLTT
jgi:hypothetical protein